MFRLETTSACPWRRIAGVAPVAALARRPLGMCLLRGGAVGHPPTPGGVPEKEPLGGVCGSDHGPAP